MPPKKTSTAAAAPKPAKAAPSHGTYQTYQAMITDAIIVVLLPAGLVDPHGRFTLHTTTERRVHSPFSLTTARHHPRLPPSRPSQPSPPRHPSPPPADPDPTTANASPPPARPSPSPTTEHATGHTLTPDTTVRLPHTATSLSASHPATGDLVSSAPPRPPSMRRQTDPHRTKYTTDIQRPICHHHPHLFVAVIVHIHLSHGGGRQSHAAAPPRPPARSRAKAGTRACSPSARGYYCTTFLPAGRGLGKEGFASRISSPNGTRVEGWLVAGLDSLSLSQQASVKQTTGSPAGKCQLPILQRRIWR
ncbi:hypothetical protein QBC39DRAFT_178866 [Podospora conica]|nr:hypothetical protein QBC39DRAFT_178866 [Schizothecium conicum]